MTDAELYGILHAANLRPRKAGKGYMARCPVHEDSTPSMSAAIGYTGKPVVYCHAGCSRASILVALGLFSGANAATRPDAPRRPVERARPPAIANPGVSETWAQYRRENPAGEPAAHEVALGIPGNGLLLLGAVWVASLGALAAPMSTGPGGEVVGVRLRADNGEKWAVKGSRNALFTPTYLHGRGPLLIPEGFTDTAALAGLGFDAIGRPSCTGGREMVLDLANGRPMVVVADADAPGQEGAWILARELKAKGCDVKVLAPPDGIKDAREWVKRGATKRAVEWAIRHRGAE